MAYMYKVELFTADVDGAGTNADVEIKIHGHIATSQWYVLDNPEDDRERGSHNIYILYNSTHLGSINRVTMRVKKADADRPDWCLRQIILTDHDAPQGAVRYEYNCNEWIYPTSYTEWVEYSPQSVGTTSSALSANTTQDGWRWCKKCQGMFFSINSAGVCPKGGGHDGSGSGHYTLEHNNSNASGQDNWRWCNKCQGLFFGGNATSGDCPASEHHNAKGSGNYTLKHNDANASGQPDWRWCHKCQGLFFAGNKPGQCPAGGQHSTDGSGQYKVDLH